MRFGITSKLSRNIPTHNYSAYLNPFHNHRHGHRNQLLPLPPHKRRGSAKA